MFKKIGVDELEGSGVWFAVKDPLTGKVIALVSKMDLATAVQGARVAYGWKKGEIRSVDITAKTFGGVNIEISDGKI